MPSYALLIQCVHSYIARQLPAFKYFQIRSHQLTVTLAATAAGGNVVQYGLNGLNCHTKCIEKYQIVIFCMSRHNALNVLVYYVHKAYSNAIYMHAMCALLHYTVTLYNVTISVTMYMPSEHDQEESDKRTQMKGFFKTSIA